MPNYHRIRVAGGTYFFTVVTRGRYPLLTRPLVRRQLRAAYIETRATMPFCTDAICLLPDHLHAIWTLPEGDADYSSRWRAIKGKLSSRLRPLLERSGAATGIQHRERSRSRRRKREAGVWQRRFWEHWIRDEEVFRRHLDYVHYNPVKHGLAASPREWRWSTFHRYVRLGWYELDWGEGSVPESVGQGPPYGTGESF